MSATPDKIKADLGAAAARLEELAAGLGERGGTMTWGVPRKVVRAYVWAVHRGADPEAACLAAWFGDPAPATPETLRLAATWAARLAAFQVNIPAASEGAV